MTKKASHTFYGQKIAMTTYQFPEDKRMGGVAATVIKIAQAKCVDSVSNNGMSRLRRAIPSSYRICKHPSIKHLTDKYNLDGLYRFDETEIVNLEIGSICDASLIEEHFKKGISNIEVKGISKGKGFAGCIKRHGFSRQSKTHGNSLSHRAPGGMGGCQDPGRVLKGKKMAGHHGMKKSHSINEILHIDTEKQFIIVRGSVVGTKNACLFLSMDPK